MKIEQLRRISGQIHTIARKFGISHILVFGSVTRDESSPMSDIDLLVEMQEGASLFGVAGFGYEVEKLLGIPVDVIPMSILPVVEDRDFIMNIQKDAIPL